MCLAGDWVSPALAYREFTIMPSVMIRRNKQGHLTLYVAKKDLEATIITMEFDTPDRWGGELRLDDGSAYFIEPLSAPPDLPITLRAKRAGES